jgi:DUF971 family protein
MQTKLIFKFEPGGGYMNQMVFIIDGPDHHIEEWSYLRDDQQTTRFDFRRKL